MTTIAVQLLATVRYILSSSQQSLVWCDYEGEDRAVVRTNNCCVVFCLHYWVREEFGMGSGLWGTTPHQSTIPHIIHTQNLTRYWVYLSIYYLQLTGCWERVYTERPSFMDILQRLKAAEDEAFFSSTSHEVFRSIQSSWKEEIRGKFIELKKVEAVSQDITHTSWCLPIASDIGSKVSCLDKGFIMVCGAVSDHILPRDFLCGAPVLPYSVCVYCVTCWYIVGEQIILHVFFHLYGELFSRLCIQILFMPQKATCTVH